MDFLVTSLWVRTGGITKILLLDESDRTLTGKVIGLVVHPEMLSLDLPNRLEL